MLKIYNFVIFQWNQILFGILTLNNSVNKSLKFQIKMLNGC